MAKRKRPSQHRRSGDPRKRAAEDAGARGSAFAETTPELEDQITVALDSGHPYSIVMLASSLIASLESADQEAPAYGLPEPAEFVRMFLDSGDAEMIVFAWVIAQLLPDEGLKAEVGLAAEELSLPEWLSPLPDAEVAGAWQATDPLRDTTDLVLTVRIGQAEDPETTELSVISLIDFNADGAVKDAFVVPASLASVRAALTGEGRAGMDSRDLPPADVRAWLSGGIAAGRQITPPFESDTWPQVRPLLEWALRLCPPGGQGWERRPWTVAEIAGLVEAFAAAPEGATVADPAAREVLVDALSVLGRETYGDPRLLSAVTLEMGLGHLWATAVHHEPDRLLALPEALGPFVRWTHSQLGIAADDTDEALAVIAHRRAEFSRDVTVAHGPDPV
ncbi:MAG: hypothetical protein QM650_12185 [Microlunatus sp.]